MLQREFISYAVHVCVSEKSDSMFFASNDDVDIYAFWFLDWLVWLVLDCVVFQLNHTALFTVDSRETSLVDCQIQALLRMFFDEWVRFAVDPCS